MTGPLTSFKEQHHPRVVFTLSHPERVAMDEYMQGALLEGIISPSSAVSFSSWEKKKTTLWPWIDYCGLNDITVKNYYQLPLMSSAFELLQGACIFTNLDLRNVYHLFRIWEGDKWKNPPQEPQNTRENVDHVHQVLQRLLQHQLFAKAEKCEFHQATTCFLALNIPLEKVKIDPENVTTVWNWPVPADQKKLQHLGFATFSHHFIENLSQVVAPLHTSATFTLETGWSGAVIPILDAP